MASDTLSNPMHLTNTKNKKEVKNHSPKPLALVAGGAGFVGSHLCDRLIADHYRVVCLDNLYTGSIDNIAHLLNHPDFMYIKQDVIQPCEVDEKLSLIFNLACPASPRHYQKNPIYTTKISVMGTLNMLELAQRNNCPMLQASTSEVYGDPALHPQPETYWGNVNPDGIRACYDEGKRCAESLCMDYHRQYGTRVKVVRIFNTYGPRMAEDDGRVVSNFITQALKGEPLTIHGDGSQTRSFMYVSDLIEGFMRMVHTPDDVTGPINLGNPEEYTVQELADIVSDLLGTEKKYVYKPLPQNDPTRRKPDITLAKSVLNWQPSVKAADGLRQVINYFQIAQSKHA
jgi:UDP-glucuronate decarboxylase